MPTSAWGEPLLVARAQQAEAPGFARIDGQSLFSWIGVDERGVHHDARMATGEGTTLPLPPRQPREQRLIAGQGGRVHLLWLDLDEDGVTQLYSALLMTPTLEVERGPIRISDGQVVDFAAADDASGSVYVAYSGGHMGEPRLVLTGIDTQGRPFSVLDRVRAAEMPTFLWQGGQLRVFWIDRERAMIRVGRVEAGRIRDVEALVPTPFLQAAERLIDLRAGADADTLYLFWNVEADDAGFRTLYSSAPLDNGTWSSWSPLGARTRANDGIESVFNIGALQLYRAGSRPLSLVAPLAHEAAILPIVGEREGRLTLLALYRGDVHGEQTLGENVMLLAPPHLAADPERNLHVTWSQIGADGMADLYYVSSVSRR